MVATTVRLIQTVSMFRDVLNVRVTLDTMGMASMVSGH